MTPRMWSVATVIVGLGLLLGGGFLWPGWFRAKAPRPSPQPNPAVGPGQHARPGKADPNPTHAMSSETSSVATGQSATSQESLRSQSLLDKTFDRVPTYLLPTGPEGQAVRVSGIPELEALLARVFGNAADLAQGPIAIRVERDRIPSHLLLDVLPNASTRATFEHFGGKRITIPEPGTSQSLAVIEASQWSIPGANDEVMALFPADQSLGLVFHPVPESPQFEPFRLVAIEGKPPSPVRLPKSFLRPGKTNLLDALDPHLIPRLPQFLGHSAPPESSHFELRPFAGDPPTPLYEAFQSDYPIPPGSELAWDLHRQRLIARMAEAGRDKEKLQKETDKLVSQIETANTNDLALGVLLGIARNTPRKPSPLANLAAFARSRGSEDYPTRSDFLEYLRALLASLKIPCDDLLDATRRKPTEHEIGQLYARLGKYPVARLEGFAQLTPDYFTNRWAQLATVDLLRAFRERLSAASQRGARLGELLHRIPSSLDSLPWIDLNVVDARGRRIEWIRFADSTPPAQP